MKLSPEQIEEIKEMIAQIRRERDAFVAEANQRVMYANGRIGQLQSMVNEDGKDSK